MMNQGRAARAVFTEWVTPAAVVAGQRCTTTEDVRTVVAVRSNLQQLSSAGGLSSIKVEFHLHETTPLLIVRSLLTRASLGLRRRLSSVSFPILRTPVFEQMASTMADVSSDLTPPFAPFFGMVSQANYRE